MIREALRGGPILCQGKGTSMSWPQPLESQVCLSKSYQATKKERKGKKNMIKKRTKKREKKNKEKKKKTLFQQFPLDIG